MQIGKGRRVMGREGGVREGEEREVEKVEGDIVR
jgi:hypothetical protein